MTLHNFLHSIWPKQGACYTLFSLKPTTKHRQQTWVHPTETQKIDAFVARTRANSQNAFMALASFSTTNRTQATAEYMRCLFADLDVGPAPKPYRSQPEALAGLMQFCTEADFPKPTWLVDSGRGLQAYWVGDTDLPIAQWQDMANRFFELCKEKGLLVDSTVSRDSARILRVPTSLHCKDLTDLREVRILMEGAPCVWGDLLSRLPAAIQLPAPPAHLQVPVDITLNTSLGSLNVTKKNFGAIIRRTFQGHGCGFLLHAVQYSEQLDEPSWRAASSIGKFCEDANEAVYAVSAKHAGYTPENTLVKLGGILTPYRCDTIRELDGCQKFCDSCTHWKKIKSPISLGAMANVIATDTPTPEAAETPTDAVPPEAPHPLDVILQNTPAPSATASTPFPYTIGQDNYTYKQLSEKEAQDAAKKDVKLFTAPDGAPLKRVYKGAITLIGRAYDTNEGEEIVQLSVVRGRDQNRFAKVPLRDVGSKDMLRKSLKQGAILNDTEATTVQDFVAKAIIMDKEDKEAASVVTHGGWASNLSSFTYGRWAIQNDGTISNVIPLAGMDTLTKVMQVKGSSSHWVTMADYWNKPGHEAMAFTLLTTFGAPLMKLMDMGTAGGLIHLFSPESGVGKSAVQNMICAAYGNPRLMIMTPQDTINSMMSLIGTYCNTPICIDEITNHPPEEVSRLVYQFSQGREKTRMDSNMNIRATSGDWNTMVVSSGNASLIDKLCALKASPDGELMRFLELRPEPLNPNEPLSDVMTGIYDNYGSVGAKYLYNVVAHQDIVREEITYVKNYINERSSMGQSHRFWMALCVANIAGGRLAKRLGFIDYDMDVLAEWTINMVNDLITSLEARIMQGGNAFGNLMAALSGHTITIPEQGLPIMPYRDPRALVDMATRRVSVSISALTQVAAEHQVSVADMTVRLQDARYRYIGQSTTNLTASMPHTMAPLTVPVYEYMFEGVV